MLRRTVVTVFVALVVSLVILLPYYCRDGAWAQYRCLAEGSFCSGITRSVETRSFTPYLGMLRSCWRSNLSHSPLYATVFVLSVYLLFRGRPCGNNRLTRYMLGGALFSWFYIVVAQPDQYLYYWFAFPLLLAVLVERWGDSLVLRAALCLLVLVAANSASRDILKSAILPREQKLGSAVERILAEVPCDARILISDRLYFGLRKHYPDLRSAFAGDAGNLTWADYCVFCSHRLVESDGVYVPQTMLKESVVAVLSQDFELLDRNLPAAKPRFAGLPIGSRPVGYGAVIYRRKETHYE